MENINLYKKCMRGGGYKLACLLGLLLIFSISFIACTNNAESGGEATPITPSAPTTFIVTFSLDGGNGDTPAPQTIQNGKTAIKPIIKSTLTKEDYKDITSTDNIIWLTQDNKQFDFDTPITEDITLKVRWTKLDALDAPTFSYNDFFTNTLKIEADNNSEIYYTTDGTDPKDKAATPIKYNASDGINTKNLNGKTIKAYAKAISGSNKKDSEVAQFLATLFTVTFNTDGATSGNIASQIIHNGGKIKKPTETLTKSGYKDFLANQETWLNGTSEFDFNTTITSDITLKPKWQEKAITSITLNIADETMQPITELEANKTAIITATAIYDNNSTLELQADCISCTAFSEGENPDSVYTKTVSGKSLIITAKNKIVSDVILSFTAEYKNKNATKSIKIKSSMVSYEVQSDGIHFTFTRSDDDSFQFDYIAINRYEEGLGLTTSAKVVHGIPDSRNSLSCVYQLCKKDTEYLFDIQIKLLDKTYKIVEEHAKVRVTAQGGIGDIDYSNFDSPNILLSYDGKDVVVRANYPSITLPSGATNEEVLIDFFGGNKEWNGNTEWVHNFSTSDTTKTQWTIVDFGQYLARYNKTQFFVQFSHKFEIPTYTGIIEYRTMLVESDFIKEVVVTPDFSFEQAPLDSKGYCRNSENSEFWQWTEGINGITDGKEDNGEPFSGKKYIATWNIHFNDNGEAESFIPSAKLFQTVNNIPVGDYVLSVKAKGMTESKIQSGGTINLNEQPKIKLFVKPSVGNEQSKTETLCSQSFKWHSFTMPVKITTSGTLNFGIEIISPNFSTFNVSDGSWANIDDFGLIKYVYEK